MSNFEISSAAEGTSFNNESDEIHTISDASEDLTSEIRDPHSIRYINHTYRKDSTEYETDDDGNNPKLTMFRTKSNANEPSINAPPYSQFGRKAKMLLVLQCAFTGFYSSIAGAIYYPVLTTIERLFHITEEEVNITVVVYFLFQGLSPSIMGGLADTLGRRPIVLISIFIYVAACIGLACSNNYTQIVVLRCLQAAGISPVIAINSGIMGDITTRAERGGYVGYVSGFQVVGSALGALIGALLSARWGWRSIFWFLAVGSGACGSISLFMLPETKRTVVGNGSVEPKSYVNYAPILKVPAVRKSLHMDDPQYETIEPKVHLNILAPFSILKVKEVDILLFVAGMQFATNTTHQTALSTALSKHYNLSVTQIGLSYLPTGLCTLVSVVTSGRYLNWAYRRQLAKHNEWLDEQTNELMAQYNDMRQVKDIMENDPKYTFNIFKARLSPAFVTLILSSSGFIAFGWCITYKAPLAAVLVCSGFASLFSNCILTFSTTLMVDLFPSKASTATSCLNLYRCLLSVVFIASLSKMNQSMTYGGVFTFLSGLTALSALILLYPVRHGKEIAFRRRIEEQKLIDDFRKSNTSEQKA